MSIIPMNPICEPIDEEISMIMDFMEIREHQSSYDSYGTKVPIWYTIYQGYRTPAFGVPEESVKHFIKDSQFHCQWGWLMPVVEKICAIPLRHEGEPQDYPFLRIFGMLNPETQKMMVRFDGFPCFQAKTLLDATWEAVIDFLKWKSKNL